MEEKLKMQLVSSSMEYVEEQFYEEIEAPKFVDFTVPNHFSPDDRFWFCARVGCDQKHEEEMDSEAIYKDFVLRVMAARSPNVRFRRAITRKPLSDSKKCPLSAPPKPSKSGLPRLALVCSSISKKLVTEENAKQRSPAVKVKKPTATPKARVKHVAAKYMTSPKKKKGSSPNPNAFRSARNPRKTSVPLPKSKVVAKALVFNSPKKALKKTPEDLGTPITKLCEGVKKLQINSHKKGIARKLSKGCTSERQKFPLDGWRKITSSCKAKTREIDAKICRGVNSKAKTNCRKKGDVSRVGPEKRGDESSDMEIDEKSRCGSLEMRTVTITPMTGESSGGVSSNCQKSESSGQDSDRSKEERTTRNEATGVGEQQEIDNNTADDVRDQNTVSEAGENADKENEKPHLHIESKVSTNENSKETQDLTSDEKSQEKGNITATNIENQNPKLISEPEENEDKENALNFADIRNLNTENLNKHNASVKLKIQAKQTFQKMDKATKENCPVGTGAQVSKNRKLKTTNPKPFRLRTDERGILKEATLDKKANSTENSSTASENSQGTGKVTEKGTKKDESRSLKKDQLVTRTIKSRYNKTLKETEPKSEKSSRTTRSTRSPFLQDHRKIASNVKFRGPCKNGETGTTMSRPKGSKSQAKEADDPINKASAVPKSVAEGRRTGTIPREPKFHSLHKSKSSTRNKP